MAEERKEFLMHLAANVEAGHVHDWVPVFHIFTNGVRVNFQACKCGAQRNRFYG